MFVLVCYILMAFLVEQKNDFHFIAGWCYIREVVKNEEKYLLLTLKEDWMFERGPLILDIFNIFLLHQIFFFLMIKLFSCQM